MKSMSEDNSVHKFSFWYVISKEQSWILTLDPQQLTCWAISLVQYFDIKKEIISMQIKIIYIRKSDQ